MEQTNTGPRETAATGQCDCGAVKYEVHGPLRDIVACHCQQCRRTSGHYVAASAAERAHLRLVEDRGLDWYTAVPGFKRGFCTRCGSSLFFEEEGAERVSIAAGSLDCTVGLSLVAHIYTHEAGTYYEIDPDAPGPEAVPKLPY